MIRPFLDGFSWCLFWACGEAAGDEALPLCISTSCLGHVASPMVGDTRALSSINFYDSPDSFASFLEKMKSRSWRMAKGLFSSRLSNTAVQSSPCLPLSCTSCSPSTVGFVGYDLLVQPSGVHCNHMLQAGVSHTVDAASWEMQTTHWLTLLYSKTPGKTYMDVEKEYWFLRHITEPESRQLFSLG